MAQLYDISVDDFMVESVELASDPATVDENMTKIPSLLAYWNAQLAAATREHLLSDLHLDTVRANVRSRIQSENEGRKLTVADLDALVIQDEDVQAAHKARIEAEASRISVRGMVDAVAAKRDMLQSIGARLRIEMASDSSVARRANGERD